MGDIHVNVFTFGANTASIKDGIYLLDAQTTIDPIIDDEGKSAHSLHLFANDDLQPLPDGTCTIPTVIIAGKVSCSAFSVKQENGFDMDVSQYVASPQQNMQVHCYYPKGHPHFNKTPLPAASKHVVVQGTVHSISRDRCIVTITDIALGPLDTIITTDDSSETVPPTMLKQFDWGGVRKDKEKGKTTGKGKGKEKEEDVESNDKNEGKRAHDDDDDKYMDGKPSTSTAAPHKINCESSILKQILFMLLKKDLGIVNQCSILNTVRQLFGCESQLPSLPILTPTPNPSPIPEQPCLIPWWIKLRDHPLAPIVPVNLIKQRLCCCMHASNSTSINPRSIVIRRHGNHEPEFINILSWHYEPLHYVLLFPHADIGWGANDLPGIPHLSQIEWYHSRLLANNDNRFSIFGRLTCEYLVDMYSRTEEAWLAYILHEQHFHGYEVHANAAAAAGDDENDKEEFHPDIKLPASFVGLQAWSSEQTADAMALG
ncbi:hypothetical protein BDR05DRAFT_1001189 [Suillus weaverae]|nr:hypothetical protein BDR05DRAFT_1001189 [Suillus weaverae]